MLTQLLIIRNAASQMVGDFRYNRRPDVIAWKAETERIAGEREQLLKEYIACNRTRASIAHLLAIIHRASAIRYLLVAGALGVWLGLSASTMFGLLVGCMLLGQVSKSIAWQLVVEPVHLPEFPPQPRR